MKYLNVIDTYIYIDIDIESILKKSLEGIAALKYYQENKIFTNEQRIDIADILIRNELSAENDYT